jgi:putative membrane protein
MVGARSACVRNTKVAGGATSRAPQCVGSDARRRAWASAWPSRRAGNRAPMTIHRSLALGLAVLATAGATAASAQAAALSGLDKTYLSGSIQGDRFEIAGGKLALSKSQNAKVRALGARLVKDHGKSLAESSRMAHHFGLDVPKAPTPSQRWELQILGTLSGPAFDQWYSRLEVADHHQDITEAAGEVTDGTDQQVRSAAHDEIPILRQHLRLSQDALKAS